MTPIRPATQTPPTFLTTPAAPQPAAKPVSSDSGSGIDSAKIPALSGNESQDFVRGLGLRWQSFGKKNESYLDTIVELQEAFDINNAGDNIVWEVSRILGEAHANKLRTGHGLPPQSERQVMIAAYSQAFNQLKGELEDIGPNPDPSSFDDSFRVASCLTKDAFRSTGGGDTFRQRVSILENLRKQFLTRAIDRLIGLREKSYSVDYLLELNQALPLIIEHSKKTTPAMKAKLRPSLNALAVDAIWLNAVFSIFSNDRSRRFDLAILDQKFDDDCRTAVKLPSKADNAPPNRPAIKDPVPF